MKSDNRKKAGLLHPIPIPSRKWEQITTDWVTDLPPLGGYTTITVFVDRLTKMVHFAPCTKEISADQYAQLFVDNVFRLHGTPEVIISNHDPRFTSRFQIEFFQILRMDLQLSTTFHPQTDGQSQVTIRMLENFLRPYVELHPQMWNKRLSRAEFAPNNAINASKGYTPFYLNAGEDVGILVVTLGVAMGTGLAGVGLVSVSQFSARTSPLALGGLQRRYQ